MKRITFSNFGILEQMFFETSEKEAIELFWCIFGSAHVPRNTGGIRIMSTGDAKDTNDRGGFLVGSPVNIAA